MSKEVQDVIVREFEVLAARFQWGDLDGNGMSRLFSLTRKFPVLEKRFHRLGRLDAFLEENAHEGVAPIPASGTHKKFLPNSLLLPFAAAAVFLLVSGVYFMIPVTPLPTFTARSILSLGACNNKAGPVKIGAVLAGGSIESGPVSICDLQFSTSGQGLMRLYPNSRAAFRRQDKFLRLTLEAGRILVDSKPNHSNEVLEVYMEGLRVRFLGTRVLFEKLGEGAYRIRLQRGKIKIESGNYLYARSPWRQLPGVERSSALFKGEAFIMDRPGEILVIAAPDHEIRRRIVRELEGRRKSGGMDKLYVVLSPQVRSRLESPGLKMQKRALSQGEVMELEQDFVSLFRSPKKTFQDKETELLPPPGFDARKVLLRAMGVKGPIRNVRLELKGGASLEGVSFQEGDEFVLITTRKVRRIKVGRVMKITNLK